MEETVSPVEEADMDEWLPIDTIFCIIILLFMSVIMLISARVAWLYLHNKWSIKGKNKINKDHSDKTVR
jgi:hypothetical protein